MIDVNSAAYQAQNQAYLALPNQQKKLAMSPKLGTDQRFVTGTADINPYRYIWDGSAYVENPNSPKSPGAVEPTAPAAPGIIAGAATPPSTPSAPGAATPSAGGPVNSGIVSGTMNAAPSMTPAQVAQYNPFGSLSPQTNVNAVTAPVQQNELVQGQLQTLLDPGNPLLQRSKSLALGDMNARGMVSSSMANQAGLAAMYDKALEIATPDAATYANRAMFNATTENETNRFNAGETNKFVGQGADIASQFGLQQNQFQFQSGEGALDRASNEKLTQLKIASDAALSKAQMSHDAAMTNLKVAADAANTDKSIAAQTNLQKAQQEFAGSQAELDRLYNTNSELQKQLYQSAENEKDRQAQTTVLSIQQAFTGQENALDRQNQVRLLELQGAINNANLPKATAADLILNLGKDIATVASSGDLKADAKTIQINNLYDVANANLAYLSKTYGVELGTVTPKNAVTAPASGEGVPSAAAVAEGGSWKR